MVYIMFDERKSLLIDENKVYSYFCGTYANSADPDGMPQNAASDQGLFVCLQNVL